MIEINDLSKIYEGDDYRVAALDSISLKIEEGEYVAVMGPSGSGKTTLLNIIGCMDSPTEGDYFLNEKNVSEMSGRELTNIRKEYVSFVFQNFALMPDYTAYENIEVPLLARNVHRKERKDRIIKIMQRLGIENLINKLPSQMSGGQQQRVAIARALVADNLLILADEPTGALDQNTSKDLMDLFDKIHKDGHTVIIITHDLEVAKRADKIIEIVDGKITKIKNKSTQEFQG
ncbi:MAG: ABC transporter ATP-binding protein [Lachnospiraceae bacterium]|nr:ABC transporter ATP-binding protein [Lachnospiraceae bacterium]